MKTLIMAAAALAILAGCDRPGNSAAAESGVSQEDLAKKLSETWGKAADWLLTKQDGTGCWKVGPEGKEEPSPSFTSIIITAIANGPKDLRPKYKDALGKAVAFLESKANADGSFGEGKTGTFVKTYSTALALMALATVDREKHADKIRGAQAYLKQNQLREGAHRGGNGYGDEEPRGATTIKKEIANLSVTGFAAEGLEMSGLPKDDEYWKLVVEFVRKCQNNSEVNNDPEFVAKLKAKNLVVGDDGGLYYTPVADPGLQKAGTKKLADKESIASYGSMTYEGIKTYLYAGLKKDSPEVKAAVDWVRKNYSVEGHPGFAFDEVKRNHLRGLYYYYLVMARALDAYGENPFATFDGKKHEWPKEIAEQLLKTVRESKMWSNDNAGWYEADPVLVTSYALNTVDILLKHLK